jgi:hypothetical protein
MDFRTAWCRSSQGWKVGRGIIGKNLVAQSRNLLRHQIYTISLTHTHLPSSCSPKEHCLKTCK